MGLSRPRFFRPFLFIISIIQIEQSVDGVLWIRTHGRMMVGADDTHGAMAAAHQIKSIFISFYTLRLIYITTKMCRFCVRLAGFMNLKFFSLEIKWPILMQKRCVFVVV